MRCSRSGGGAGLALGLDHLKALELGMAEIEALAGLVVGAGVRATELFRAGPGLERRFVHPGSVRRIEPVVIGERSLEQMEFDEAGHVAEIGFALRPQILK